MRRLASSVVLLILASCTVNKEASVPFFQLKKPLFVNDKKVAKSEKLNSKEEIADTEVAQADFTDKEVVETKKN